MKKEGFPEKERKEVIKGMGVKEEMRVTPEEFEGLGDWGAEINFLKLTDSSGYRLNLIPKERRDSVAEHVSLVGHLAFVIAMLEGLDPEQALQCAGLAVFHDDPETRLGDVDKLSARYLDLEKAFEEALREQVQQLPKIMAEPIYNFVMEVHSRKTKRGNIAKDADTLERAYWARILASAERFRSAEEFYDPREEEKLQTEGAKTLMNLIRRKRSISTHWRKGLKVE